MNDTFLGRARRLILEALTSEMPASGNYKLSHIQHVTEEVYTGTFKSIESFAVDDSVEFTLECRLPTHVFEDLFMRKIDDENEN